ncbi:DNA fragmentation factor-related protein 4 [Arctopsyche grandis]|uniref:DNA fragmentation factor-related protein 4 n=1 Tax=Arctopsyche grandis TaxID=121162 RepID=UPI00406DA0E5
MERGWKVTDAARRRKVGVAAANLQLLKQKACDKLQVCDDWESCQCFVAEDGTLVDNDEYLLTLRPQTLLIITKPGDVPKTEFEFQLGKIISANNHIIEVRNAIHSFFKENPHEVQTIQKYIGDVEEPNMTKSKLEEDPEWFKDIETKDRTKEGYMRYRAKSRIRSYFYKIKKILNSSDIYKKKLRNKKVIDTFIKNLEVVLEANKCQEFYFDRKTDKDKLCDENGKFICGGLWNQQNCEDMDHFINPYGSKAKRIIFQTWNLDHCLELSRTVAPSILEALKNTENPVAKCFKCNKPVDENAYISAPEYYKLLFTRSNLKLVHIVCHDKKKHNGTQCIFITCNTCHEKEQKPYNRANYYKCS